MVQEGYYSNLVQLGSVRCAEIHQRLSYIPPFRGIITDLKINQTTLVSYTAAGSLDINGYCKGSSFKSEKGEWEDVVVQAKFKIYITEGTAIANSKENIIILPVGTRMKLSGAYGIDTFKGEVIWKNEQHNCKDNNFTILYDGPATLITVNKKKENSDTLTYLVETDSIAFALKYMKKSFACDIRVTQTEHTHNYTF